MRSFKVLGGAMALLICSNANAQLFGQQNTYGPLGTAQQENYPYPGQCYAGATDPGWGIPKCVIGAPGVNEIQAKSFLCEDGTATQSPGEPTNFTAGPGRTCGAVVPYQVLRPIDPDATTPKFQWELLNPPDYTPDTNKFPGAHYYELGLHEAWNFQGLAGLGLFPNPALGTCPDSASTTVSCTVGDAVPAACLAFDAAAVCTGILPGAQKVPNGMQWTGLTCNIAGGCNCPAEAGAYCSGTIPVGAPIFTPIWGIGQVNDAGALSHVLRAAGTPSASSANNYTATWPSISVRGQRGTPVVIKWKNEFPNNHTFCPHPEAADWPCAIDRTFMGVKAKVDPALEPAGFADFGVNTEGVNQFGSPQQPDNSWVTHLHGGEIPPSVDGFAMKWYGNAVTGAMYNKSATATFITPHFDGPHIGAMFRPGGNPATNAAEAWNYDTYAYPMEQEEALIWFHDHTLGKTHHNVIAGPAGFFPVSEPAKHGDVTGGNCAGGGSIFDATQPVACSYTWLDPVTRPMGVVGNFFPLYDLFFAIQDRSFNEDGSINFSNGLGQPIGQTNVPNIVNGDNNQVHPVWLPEYFGNHAVINGVLWPKKTVENGWYRIRFANGSDSRCYTSGLWFDQASGVVPAPGVRLKPNVPFYVIANDQGYLAKPKLIPAGGTITHCPGERYELLVNFGNVAPFVGIPDGSVYMTNQAGAPYPAGTTPFEAGSPDAHLNVLMRFDRLGSGGIPTCPNAAAFTSTAASVGTCLPNPATIGINPNFQDLSNSATASSTSRLPTCFTSSGAPRPGVTRGVDCITAIRQMYLNERVDGLTDAPLGMQINGVPFEYRVTETPIEGDIELWRIINLTVDAHPMHPHAVKHQIVSRRRLDVGLYKQALCGSTSCQPGTAPGGEMQVVPDVDGTPLGVSFYTGAEQFIANGDYNAGNKDASIVLPGYVTNIIAKWHGTWNATVGTKLAPGVPGSLATYTTCSGANDPLGGAGTPSADAACSFAGGNDWKYEAITSGPYVWHCHINSHEDSEMMRTSLVVP